MKALPYLLSGGAGSTAFVAAEALVALQGPVAVSPQTGVPLEWVVQLGFLLSAIAAFVYAGRVVGRWETAQAKLVETVATNTADSLANRERIATLEGMVAMLENRTRTPREEPPQGQLSDGGAA